MPPISMPANDTTAPVLTHVAQEAAEVVMAYTKLALYGPRAQDPRTGQRYDNIDDLHHEIGDLLAVIERAVETGHLDPMSLLGYKTGKLKILRGMYS